MIITPPIPPLAVDELPYDAPLAPPPGAYSLVTLHAIAGVVFVVLITVPPKIMYPSVNWVGAAQVLFC
jgi:hypothetical protein